MLWETQLSNAANPNAYPPPYPPSRLLALLLIPHLRQPITTAMTQRKANRAKIMPTMAGSVGGVVWYLRWHFRNKPCQRKYPAECRAFSAVMSWQRRADLRGRTRESQKASEHIRPTSGYFRWRDVHSPHQKQNPAGKSVLRGQLISAEMSRASAEYFRWHSLFPSRQRDPPRSARCFVSSLARRA